MFLEDLAYRMLALPSESIGAIYVAAMVFGGIVGVFILKGHNRTGRITFLVGMAAIFMLINAMNMIWLAAPSLAKSDVTYLLPMITLLGTFLAGMGVYKLGRGRSFDINGTGSLAALAFIPFANLYLMFAAPGKETAGQVRQRTSVPQIFLGIIAASFFLMFGFVFSNYLDSLDDKDFQLSDALVAKSAKARIESSGVEEFMRQEVAKASSKLPMKVGMITIDKIKPQGNVLHYHAVLDKSLGRNPTINTKVMRDNLCGDEDPSIKTIFKEGGGMQYDYARPDGSPYQSFLYDQEVCDGLKPPTAAYNSPWASN